MQLVIKKLFTFFFLAGFLLFVFYFLTIPVAVKANWTEAVIGRPLVPAECHGAADNCQLSDLVRVGINIFDLILGILGSVSLAMFVYGGFIWILSRGNASMVEKGKNIIFGTIIGISFVLGSWLIVNVVLGLVLGQGFKSVTLFNSNPNTKTSGTISHPWSHFNP